MPNDHPNGYLATPPTGRGRPVLLLHAWWGLNDVMKAVCDRFAESGFVAFAPDLYHGQVTADVDRAEVLAGGLDPAQTQADLAAAVRFLDQHPGGTGGGLAVVGFSLGAFHALDLSVTYPQHVRSVVVFYGTRPGDYGDSQAAYLGHFAESDPFEPQSEVDRLEEALRQAGRPVTFYRYPDTGHWFFESDREKAFNRPAARLAWDRTLAFLKQSPAP